MGQLINLGNEDFKMAIADKYVDKTNLISVVNSTIATQNRFSCVTRSRRFGKTMAATMLRAYYDKSCDSYELFAPFAIAKDPTFEKHLNKYRVIFITMTDFISKYGHNPDIVEILKQSLIDDLMQAYPDVRMRTTDDVMDLLLSIATEKGEKFIMIIDEWDALCREFSESSVMDQYVELLRRLFKGSNTARVFDGAYITGILPIKRYNTQSSLNNFSEYSMIVPGPMASYFGFTPTEVNKLCESCSMDFDEVKKWYDGYKIGDEPSIFNPNSVVQAIIMHKCANFWITTSAYDDVANYIQRNFYGLKDDIISMLSGGRCRVNYIGFDNDIKEIKSRDDVLTALIHLGYLAYDSASKECYIPNLEVAEVMEKAVRQTDWIEVIGALEDSDALLKAVIDGNEEVVASGIAKVHNREVSILSYNDENSLACVLSLAFFTARNQYVVHREMHSGKGFVDMAFVPRKGVQLPAIVIELKYNKDAITALDQIRNKEYPAIIKEYTHNMILVGINYDKDTKTHTCKIIPHQE